MNLIEVTSSHGTFRFDANNGHIYNGTLTESFGALPVLINIWEFNKYYRTIEDPYPLDNISSIDILDLGYIDANGDYEEACVDWRKEREMNLRLTETSR